MTKLPWLNKKRIPNVVFVWAGIIMLRRVAFLNDRGEIVDSLNLRHAWSAVVRYRLCQLGLLTQGLELVVLSDLNCFNLMSWNDVYCRAIQCITFFFDKRHWVSQYFKLCFFDRLKLIN